MGGAEASDSLDLASSDTVGQTASSALPAASCIAKAKQVGTPHFPQFVFGNNLKISIPVRGIRCFSCYSNITLCATPARP
jgi:hypothetical protein